MAELVTIYMPFLNEGTEAWRPITAERLGADTFRIIGPKPDDEEWAFAPGDVVRGMIKQFSDGQNGIVAIALSSS